MRGQPLGGIRSGQTIDGKALNVHLMVIELQRYLASLLKRCGSLVSAQQFICIRHSRRFASLERKQGVVLEPVSPLELIEYVPPPLRCRSGDTVHPGFSGQTFLPEMLPKIRRLPAICSGRDFHPVIEVDGGENIGTTGQAAAGVTAAVAGAAIFGTKDDATAIAAIRTNAIAASQS